MEKIKSFIQKELFILKLKKATKNKVLFQFLEDNGHYIVSEDGSIIYKMPEFK